MSQLAKNKDIIVSGLGMPKGTYLGYGYIEEATPYDDMSVGELVELPYDELMRVPWDVRSHAVNRVVANPDMKVSEKRRLIDILKGKRRTKQVYQTPEERKEASRARSKQRREERKSRFEGTGLTPKSREKMTDEEKKQKRKDRRQGKKDKAQKQADLLARIAAEDPERLIKYGFNPEDYIPKV